MAYSYLKKKKKTLPNETAADGAELTIAVDITVIDKTYFVLFVCFFFSFLFLKLIFRISAASSSTHKLIDERHICSLLSIISALAVVIFFLVQFFERVRKTSDLFSESKRVLRNYFHSIPITLGTL